MFEPIQLTEKGDKLVNYGHELTDVTDESNLDEVMEKVTFIGVHGELGKGYIRLESDLEPNTRNRGFLFCTGTCGLDMPIPKSVVTIGDLRNHFKNLLADDVLKVMRSAKKRRMSSRAM